MKNIIDVRSINFPDDFEELINELQSTDGLFSAIQIYDSSLANALVKMGLASKNVRGSYYGTDLLRYMLESSNGDITVVVNHLKSYVVNDEPS